MQTSGTYSYGSPSGMKTAPSSKPSNIDRQARRRRRQQRGGARLTINRQPGKPEGRYA